MTSERALDLLEEYLALREQQPSVGFEDWAARHPDQGAQLREAYDAWSRVDRLLEGGSKRAPLQPGDRIAGYSLRRLLGSGGQAVVWEAEQVGLGRHIALKIMRQDRSSSRDSALFLREARAGARLRDDGIVGVHDSGEDGGLRWIAQELIPEGRTLRERIDEVRARGLIDPERWYTEAAGFVLIIARAMAVAHDAGIVHRDLKPGNILLTSDGHPKVSDFGLARLDDTSAFSKSQDLVGTYIYMSPEQVGAKRSEIDHRTDIFSLGVVMYELLTTTRPFEGDTAHQVCSSILEVDPPAPRILRSQVPHDLSVICCKALEKDPRRRYPDMTALASDVERYLQGRPIEAREPSTLERAVKWVRRHPALSASALIAGVSFIGLSGLGLSLARTNRALVAKTAEAELRSTEVLRLSLAQDHEGLMEEADELWPPYPEFAGAMSAWMARTEELIEQRHDLERVQDELEEEPNSREVRWWRAQVARLIENLDALVAPETGLMSNTGMDLTYGLSMPRRLAMASTLDTPDHRTAWRDALPRLAERYPRLQLQAQTGLVPLEPDPATGLWEFWDVLSGQRPQRSPSSGTWQIGPETGVIFILLPAARTWIGAQSEDPVGLHFDPLADENEALAEADLEAFFVSKYELTQGQWQRMMPDLRGQSSVVRNGVAKAQEPATYCTWTDAMECMRRYGFQLPTEAQWEYAARAGTTTPWWSGTTPYTVFVSSAGNLGDRSLHDALPPSARVRSFEDWTDGAARLAPVGSFSPNAFGLHDTIGNASEWCLESRTGSAEAVFRGGNFYWTASRARASLRSHAGKIYRDGSVGLRPIREVH